MSTVAIELNDTGILVASEPPLQIEASPGYVLLEGKELHLGAEAQSRARLKPRWVDNRFWEALDTSPMPKPFPRALSRADVAHDHLRAVWDNIRQQAESSDAEVLLAIPGSFSMEQLGLILGIARACEMPVTGLVDSAVAAVATRSTGSRILYLDATLHGMIWTELSHDDQLRRRRVEILESGGLLAVRDAWAKRIAELLVRRTRFDPFHHGRAEQTLYDRLPQWMGELSAEGRVLISLESEGKNYAVELGPGEAATVAVAVIEPAVELARSLVGTEEPATLMVSARVAAIPGLVAGLSALIETEVIELPELAAVEGTLQYRERIAGAGGELPFVVLLPAERRSPPRRAAPTPPPTVASASGRESLPTHVLLAGVAHAVGSEPLWLGSAVAAAGARNLEVGGSMPGLSRRHCSIRRHGEVVIVEDHSTYGTYLNGRRVAGHQTLRPGDRLRIGSPGVELQMIRVVEDDV
jgi:hypothetical protein